MKQKPTNEGGKIYFQNYILKAHTLAFPLSPILTQMFAFLSITCQLHQSMGWS